MLFYVPWQIGMKLINSIHQLHIINVYSPPIHTLYNCLKNTEKATFLRETKFFYEKNR
jgi:hypothetical protein